SAATLAQADYVLIFRGRRGACWLEAAFGQTPEFEAAYLGSLVLGPSRGTSVGRALLTGQVVQIADVTADPEYALPDFADTAALRTALSVPMLRQNEPIGVISLGRSRVEPFTDKQIELVITFADQAVIAIENVRLFDE